MGKTPGETRGTLHTGPKMGKNFPPKRGGNWKAQFRINHPNQTQGGKNQGKPPVGLNLFRKENPQSWFLKAQPLG